MTGNLVARRRAGRRLVPFALLFLTPYGTQRFWWTATGLRAPRSAHAVYWLVTHPVNNFWIKDVDMVGAGAAFFSFPSTKSGDWAQMRDIWEYSHLVRACLAMASPASMAVALTL